MFRDPDNIQLEVWAFDLDKLAVTLDDNWEARHWDNEASVSSQPGSA